MKLLVTGAKGFVGRNLVWNLKNICTGKDRTRPDLAKVLVQEQKLPFDELVEEALAGMYRVDVTPEGYEVRQ